jgi:hypothetical protein
MNVFGRSEKAWLDATSASTQGYAVFASSAPVRYTDSGEAT